MRKKATAYVRQDAAITAGSVLSMSYVTLKKQNMNTPIPVMVAGSSMQIVDMTRMLQTIPSVEVLMRVSSGTQAINNFSTLQPQIIFSDVVLYDMSGFETARFIKEQNPLVKIIMCSQKFDREFLLAVLALKLDGYLPGYGNRKVLEETIHSAMFKDSYSHFGLGTSELRQLLIYQYQSLFGSQKYAG